MIQSSKKKKAPLDVFGKFSPQVISSRPQRCHPNRSSVPPGVVPWCLGETA